MCGQTLPSFALAGQARDVVHGLAGQLGLPLGQEQPRQIVFAGS